MGVILAQTILAMTKKTSVTIQSDSQLLVNQIKGNNKVKNIRFVALMPIVHDLCKHFQTVNLDWIDREQNMIADSLAKAASIDIVKYSGEQPDFFKV